MDPEHRIEGWNGVERRSREERRRRGNRRVAHDVRRRLTQVPESDSDKQVIPYEMWDRRSGQDRRGHRIYGRKDES